MANEIKPEQVPDEVFEAFQKAWADKSTLSTKECIAAALNAWPGMKMKPWWEFMTHKRRVDLMLPLPEKPNDKA